MKKTITAIELIIIVVLGVFLYKDIDKIPVVKDYIYMIIMESLGIDIYLKLKSKL
jgi:hypothetical protein